MSLFGRANSRHLRRQPLQVVLSVVGIALGVAVVLAVDLANHSAMRAFRLSEQAVSGDATHSIVSAGAGIDEAFYRSLRVEQGFRRIAPRVTGSATTPSGSSLRVLGIDPLAAPDLQFAGGAGVGWIDAGTLIATPGAALMTAATAQNLGVSKGDTFSVNTGSRRRELTVVGVLTGEGLMSAALRQTLIMDIATAQVLLDRVGFLSRIDVHVDDQARRRLESILPASLTLRPGESRSHVMDRMTRAFRINLTALSLLALLIGGFLIYNTQTLFVLGRREFFAVWRTLGTTRRQIVARVLLEAAGLAAAGCVLGTLAGIGLASLLLNLVTRSINDLYFVLETGRLVVAPLDIAKACLLGIVASLVASVLPAREASRVQPQLALSRSGVERFAAGFRRTGVVLAPALWALGAAVLIVSQRSVTAGFVGLFCVVAGFAFLAPTGLRWLAGGAAPVMDKCFGWMGIWAARNILASMSRTQVAVTALTVALAATVGVSVMIHSFRSTVAHWLENYLRADVYISRPADDRAVDPALPARLAAITGVESVSTGLWRRLPTGSEPTRLFVLDVGERGFRHFQLVAGSNRDIWPGFSHGDEVLISESYAYHRRLEAGDSLTLPTSGGDRRFEVAGVFYDYESDRGRVVMHRDTYNRYWNDPRIESLAVYAAPGTDTERLLDEIEKALQETGLVARSNVKIRQVSLAIFDRTFTVTEVLRLLTIIVAAIGILSALVAIQLDRTRELAVLRAGGLTRGELTRVLMLEGGVMGGASALMAIPLGVVLAALLVFVINKRSFGWSMQFTVPWEQPVLALVLGLAAGIAAALYPAWRMNRQSLTRGLRYE